MVLCPKSVVQVQMEAFVIFVRILPYSQVKPVGIWGLLFSSLIEVDHKVQSQIKAA